MPTKLPFLAERYKEGQIKPEHIKGAAKEMLEAGDQNLRKKEIDAQQEYETKTEFPCILDQLSDGRWRLTTIESIGSKQIVVVRADQENLPAAMKYELAKWLVQNGTFNDFNSSKDFVLKSDIRIVTKG